MNFKFISFIILHFISLAEKFKFKKTLNKNINLIYRPENSHFYHGCLYCNIHFKLIFTPKIIYEEEHAQRKPELIIRENEPKKLPSEVARGKLIIR